MRFNQKIETLIDKDTGEIIVEKNTVVRKSDSILYTKIYPNNSELLYKAYDSNLESLLATYIILNIEFSTNKIYLLKPDKEKIMKLSGKKIDIINKAIKSLHKKEFIIRQSKGVYILNPLVAFKGNEKDRIEVMQLLKNDTITNFENEK